MSLDVLLIELSFHVLNSTQFDSNYYIGFQQLNLLSLLLLNRI